MGDPRKLKAVDYIRKGWTRWAIARDCNDAPCSVSSDEAVTWCAEGALIAAYGAGDEFDDAKNKLRHVIRRQTVTRWNDELNRTQQQVIEAMEKAGV